MDEIRRLMASGTNFLGLYIALMVPTYILPYFGSNSLFIGAASGGATLPLFLIHLAALLALCLLARERGRLIGKSWLVTLPVIAAIFDLVPLLNWVPFVPTIMHIAALAVGTPEPGDDVPPEDAFS